MANITLETVRTIACKHCGKLHRMKAAPVDAAGRPALLFRMCCLKCSATEAYSPDDIVLLKPRARRQPSGKG